MQTLMPFLLLCVCLCAFAPSRSLAASPDLGALERATVQHESTLKTLDTIGRRVLGDLTGRSTLDGERPTATLFDMAYRPDAYASRDFIKIKHLPLRQDLADAVGLRDDARHQFLKKARVSPAFLADPAIRTAFERISARDLVKAPAINGLLGQAAAAEAFLEAPLLPPLRMIPPAPGHGDGKWHSLDELMATPDSLARYDAERIADVIYATSHLRQAWLSDGDVTAAADDVAAKLVAVNPDAYPTELKRKGEVAYNRLGGLTLPGSGLYFVAMVLFLLSAYGEAPRLRLWAVRAMLVAVLVHTLGIGVRWWLVEQSGGDNVGWFHAIPIKNQFESVMFSAWFGAIVGTVLELRRKKAGGGVFGAAAAFVGFLSLLALFASPHVFGRDIGGDLKQAQGILMSYWLYVHVTTVVASYALIGMSFLLGSWYLVARWRGNGNAVAPAPANGGGLLRTLAQAVFLPVPRGTPAGAFTDAVPPRSEPGKTLLQRLDAAHVVVLQLAFWLLGLGIILGAVWADMSWGRPWGWDPKETFALVTWIVYLVILHVRLVTPNRAYWTAVLSIVGFAVMLFNWIGVNFFLVGLHSYA